MQTYSHLIVTGALNGRFGQKLQEKATGLPPLSTKIVLFGSVLPDLPLITLAILAMGYDWAARLLANTSFGAAFSSPALLGGSMTRMLFRVWFFENPWVITAYNLFHSPLLIIVYLFVGWRVWRRGYSWGGRFFWLSAAAMLHSLTDIPLHVNDGPLLLFPLNWTWRFHSPISYWDRNYYGHEWSVFEHFLDVGLLLYLFVRYRPALHGWRQRRKKG